MGSSIVGFLAKHHCLKRHDSVCMINRPPTLNGTVNAEQHIVESKSATDRGEARRKFAARCSGHRS